MGLLQIDFVNIVTPSHYLVLYSRLGTYDKSDLDRVVYTDRQFIEHWAHEASIVPMDLWGKEGVRSFLEKRPPGWNAGAKRE